MDLKGENFAHNLPFEIVAVPQSNANANNNTDNVNPINVKIKVRNKEETVKFGILSLPKLSAYNSGKKVRLVNSDQTIMSFDFFTDDDTCKGDKKKVHKNIFHFFRRGHRIRNKNDDKDIFLPTSTKNDFNETKSSTMVDNEQNIVGVNIPLKKNLPICTTSNDVIVRMPRLFLGKCKPGGCLDPPFNEDYYAYELDSKKSASSTHNEIYSNLNNKIVIPADESNQRSFLNQLINNKKLKKQVDNFTKRSEKSFEEDTPSLVTYPPTSLDGEKIYKNIPDINLKSRISEEDKARISVSEFSEIYYMPPKKEKHKTDKTKFEIEVSDKTARNKTADENKIVHSTLLNQDVSKTSLYLDDKIRTKTLETHINSSYGIFGKNKGANYQSENKENIEFVKSAEFVTHISETPELDSQQIFMPSLDKNLDKITVEDIKVDVDKLSNNFKFNNFSVKKSIESIEQTNELEGDANFKPNGSEKINNLDNQVNSKELDVLDKKSLRDSIDFSEMKVSLIQVNNKPIEYTIMKKDAVQAKVSKDNELLSLKPLSLVEQTEMETKLTSKVDSLNDWEITNNSDMKLKQSEDVTQTLTKPIHDVKEPNHGTVSGETLKPVERTMIEFRNDTEKTDPIFEIINKPLNCVVSTERNNKLSADNLSNRLKTNECNFESKQSENFKERPTKRNIREQTQIKTISEKGSTLNKLDLIEMKITNEENDAKNTERVSGTINEEKPYFDTNINEILEGHGNSLNKIQKNSIMKEIEIPDLDLAKLDSSDILMQKEDQQKPLKDSQSSHTPDTSFSLENGEFFKAINSAFIKSDDKITTDSKILRDPGSLLKEIQKNSNIKDNEICELDLPKITNDIKLLQPEYHEIPLRDSHPSFKSKRSEEPESTKASVVSSTTYSIKPYKSLEKYPDDSKTHDISLHEDQISEKSIHFKETNREENIFKKHIPRPNSEIKYEKLNETDFSKKISISSTKSQDIKKSDFDYTEDKSLSYNLNSVRDLVTIENIEISTDDKDVSSINKTITSTTSMPILREGEKLSLISDHKKRLTNLEETTLKSSLLRLQYGPISINENGVLYKNNTVDYDKKTGSKNLIFKKVPEPLSQQSSKVMLETNTLKTTLSSIDNGGSISMTQILKNDKPNLLNMETIKNISKTPTYSSIVIDFKFRFIEDNNILVITTVDSTMPHDNLKDEIIAIKSLIRENDDEIRLPINNDTDLTLQIKKVKEHTSLSHLETSDFEESNKIQKPTDILLQETLNSVYQNLIPLEDIIKLLREEADFLLHQQTSLKNGLRTLGSKPVRLIHTNRRCNCNN